MIMDSATYALNYWMERQRASNKRSEISLKWIEIYVSSISVGVLISVSVVFFLLACDRIVYPHEPSPDHTVDSSMMLLFSSMNFIVDIVLIACYLAYSLIDGERRVVNMNLCSAGLHVAADFMRTLSVIVASIIAHKRSDSELIDAYCAIIVEMLILCPTAVIVFHLVEKVQKLRGFEYMRIRAFSDPDESSNSKLRRSSP